MPNNYTSAGADAATNYDDYFRQIIANDPQIQQVIRSVWGDTPVDQRPSDTPKNLEKANDQASKQITQILAQKGIQLPDRTFINPRTGALEGHRGWAGLSGVQKALIIAAAAGAGGLGAIAATGGLAGGAGAAGAGAAGSGAGTGAAATGAGLAGIATPATTAGIAGGVLPGAAIGLPGAGLGIGAGAAGAGAAGAGLLPSTSLAGVGTAPAATVGNMAGGTMAGSTGGGGFMSHLLGAVTGRNGAQGNGSLMSRLLSGNALQGYGQALGALSGTQAHNRGVALDAMMQGDQMKLAQERQREQTEADLIKKMNTLEYIKGGGFQPHDTYSVTGAKLPSFDFGARPSTQAQIDMATTLEKQLQDRANNPLQLSDYNSKMNPGKAETAANWLGTGASLLGALNGANSYTPPKPNGGQ